MTTFIALLRGINVVGRNKVPMGELRAHCEKAGFHDVQTYIASGNVVLTGPGKSSHIEAKLEALVAQRFKVQVPVIVRTAQQWPSYVESNPFPSAAPKHVHLCLSKARPSPDCVAGLSERAAASERIKLVGDALWIDYANGVGESKLTPAFLDKTVGSPVTARNWNTVHKLAEIAGV